MLPVKRITSHKTYLDDLQTVRELMRCLFKPFESSNVWRVDRQIARSS